MQPCPVLPRERSSFWSWSELELPGQYTLAGPGVPCGEGGRWLRAGPEGKDARDCPPSLPGLDQDSLGSKRIKASGVHVENSSWSSPGHPVYGPRRDGGRV